MSDDRADGDLQFGSKPRYSRIRDYNQNYYMDDQFSPSISDKLYQDFSTKIISILAIISR